MNTWSPLFSRIVDSSIWLEEDCVVKVFITMLAKKDADHVVRGSAFNIAKWANKTEGEVLGALKVLAEPDTKRLEPQPYDGRRIEKVGDGWLILNGQHYEDEMRRLNRREYKTVKQREYRAKRSGKSAVERLMEKAGSREELARVEEMAGGVKPGSLGGYGPEAEAVVNRQTPLAASSSAAKVSQRVLPKEPASGGSEGPSAEPSSSLSALAKASASEMDDTPDPDAMRPGAFPEV